MEPGRRGDHMERVPKIAGMASRQGNELAQIQLPNMGDRNVQEKLKNHEDVSKSNAQVYSLHEKR